MKLSTDRILTTHVGSLPRPQSLVALLIKKDRDEPYDRAEFAAQVRQAVADIVARQVKIGIDVVSDGEASKVGYATYVHERLTGFGGEPYVPKPNRDVAPYADFRRRLELFIGPQQIRRLCCTGPIARQDHESAQRDIDNFKAAIAASKPVDAFMPAASPGVVSTFQPNRHYPNHAAYIDAIGAAMREEYEAIANAGIVVQLDSPDLAMARHTGFQDLTEAEFLKQAEQQVEALNHALANVPASSARLHLCWGNYEGPHDFDIPLAEDPADRSEGKAAGDLVRGGQSAARARMDGVAGDQAAGRQGADPRRDRHLHQLHRASGTGGAAHLPLRRRRRARAGDRRHGLRVLDFGRHRRARGSRDRVPQAGVAGGRRADRIASGSGTDRERRVSACWHREHGCSDGPSPRA